MQLRCVCDLYTQLWLFVLLPVKWITPHLHSCREANLELHSGLQLATWTHCQHLRALVGSVKYINILTLYLLTL